MMVQLPEKGSLSALIFSLSWFLLSNIHVAMKALGFTLVFPDEQAILNLVALCPFHLAEGLSDVVQAPPTANNRLLQVLAIDRRDMVAIYVLVPEKAGQRAKIYIASGRDATKGYPTRMNTYQKRVDTGAAHGMPGGVERALNDGHIITHKATLAWTTIPMPSEKSALTGLLLLECFFTVCF